MKEVILHIGTHKTGSTSIQSALTGYNDGKTRVTSPQNANHSIPIYTIFSKYRYNYHTWADRGVAPSAIDTMRSDFLKILEKDLLDQQYERLIISGEDISILDREEKNKLVKFFTDANVQVKVFVYVRSPLGQASSRSQQYIKRGLNNHPIKPDYENIISPFIQLLSRDEVFVYDYDAIMQSNSDVVDHFSMCLNLKLNKAERMNTSLNPEQLAYIFKLNSVPIKVLGNPLRFQIRQILRDCIIKHSANPRHTTKLDKSRFEHLIDPAAKADCQWLKDNFNIDYDYNIGDTHGNLEQYFDSLLADDRNCLIQTFDELDLKYDIHRSIENNFLEAYLALTEKRYQNFKAASYLQKNPDVAKAGVNPYEHFMKFGINEGRRY